MTFPLAILVLVATVFGAVTGFGLSTLVVPFLLLFFPFEKALLFGALLHLVSEIGTLLLYREERVRLGSLFAVAATGLLAAVAGAELSFTASAAFMERLTGLVLLLYVISLFRFPAWPGLFAQKSRAALGGLGGLLSGLFGIAGLERSVIAAGGGGFATLAAIGIATYLI